MYWTFEKYSQESYGVVSTSYEDITFDLPNTKLKSNWTDSVGSHISGEFKKLVEKYGRSLTETWDKLTKYKTDFNPANVAYDDDISYKIDRLEVR
jgi:hypothetical protein